MARKPKSAKESPYHIRAWRMAKGMTLEAVAADLGMTSQNLGKIERGMVELQPAHLVPLAAILGIEPADLLRSPRSIAADGPPSETLLPIIGQIRAGAWLEEDDTAHDGTAQEHPVTLDRRYPNARQWLRAVVGDSMNQRHIYEGDLAHLVDWFETGLEPATGMIVEVVRTRAGGLLREVTLKEIEVRPGQILLWPRSTNPMWREPVALGCDRGEDVEVRITGLLLNAFRKFN